jgi:hypothetical protein
MEVHRVVGADLSSDALFVSDDGVKPQGQIVRSTPGRRAYSAYLRGCQLAISSVINIWKMSCLIRGRRFTKRRR